MSRCCLERKRQRRIGESWKRGQSSSRRLMESKQRVAASHLDIYHAGYDYMQKQRTAVHWQRVICEAAVYVSTYGLCILESGFRGTIRQYTFGLQPCENSSDATPASLLPLWLESCVPPVSQCSFCLNLSFLFSLSSYLLSSAPFLFSPCF